MGLDDEDLVLNFDEEENGDIRQQDQLPTIFEKSHMEQLETNEGQDLKLMKFRTHIKKQSEQIDTQSFMSNQFAGYMEPDAVKAHLAGVPNPMMRKTESQNLTALR